VLDAEPIERTADLGAAILVDRFAGLVSVKVVAAAVSVERAGQPVCHEDFEQTTECRGRPFLLRQERRIDRARGVIHRDDQIERRLPFQPSLPQAVLVEHHACAWLPLALAPLRSTALRPLHQPGRMQLRLRLRVAQANL
jgi:hypothetical protein